jgi:GR25 family glycosyltransferase involved in LPS biosynthesis
MVRLNLYVIYSQHLENRQKYINSTIEFIKNISEKNELSFNVNIIAEPSKEFIDKNIENFNKRVNYSKYSDDTKENRDFNGLIQPLNSCQISNIEKHREIYKNIIDKDDRDLYMILEDDAVVGQEYVHNIEQLFKKLKDNKFENKWDILFTCLPSMNQGDKMALLPINETYSFLMNKSSYFIRPHICKQLIDYTETFRFTLKTALSRFFYENKDIKAMYLNKHTFLEASKIGIVPSTINPNNFLFQNNHFIQLSNISNQQNITGADIKEVEKIYENSKQIESADILHIIGIIYYKYNDIENAKKYMTLAVENMKKNKGYLQPNSEILNNCINIYQYNQENLEEYKKTIPKY